MQYQSTSFHAIHCKIDIITWRLNLVHFFDMNGWQNELEAPNSPFAHEDSSVDGGSDLDDDEDRIGVFSESKMKITRT
ncbi:hypothetical protein ACH5RR_003369 [Cinchona calisaya]|uniref:Uncharacterized protein n=1 Tax=Cinchona calisaya TaxID=153742 RepID=A0ABD3AUM3_9GENT